MFVFGHLALNLVGCFDKWAKPRETEIAEIGGLGSTDLSTTCTRAVGECSVTGPLASVGIGAACWGWRGSTTCRSGSCECDVSTECGGADGYCHDAHDWDAGFAARGVRLTSGGKTLVFNSTSLEFGAVAGAAGKGRAEALHDDFYIYRLPGPRPDGAKGPWLLGPDRFLQASILAGEEFETLQHGDCFPGQDLVELEPNLDAAKRECLERGCSVIVEYRGFFGTTMYLRPPSVTSKMCRESEYATENVDLHLRVDSPFLQRVGPSLTTLQSGDVSGVHFEHLGKSRFRIVADGGVAHGWCLETIKQQVFVTWVPTENCTATWTLDPPIPAETLESTRGWTVPESFVAQAAVSDGEHLTCKAKQALGPDTMMVIGPFTGLSAAKFPIHYVCSWLMGLLGSMGMFRPYPQLLLSFLAIFPTIIAAIVCIVLFLLGLFSTVIFSFLGFVLIVPMVKLNWGHIDRAIIFCCHNIPFSFSAFPFALVKMFYGLIDVVTSKPTNNNKRPNEVSACVTYEEMLDAFVDLMAFVSMLGVFPLWLVFLDGITVAVSCTFAIAYLKEYIKQYDLQCIKQYDLQCINQYDLQCINQYWMQLSSLLFEDILQWLIMLLTFRYQEATEFMLYSFVQHTISMVKKVKLIAVEHCCKSSTEQGAHFPQE